MEKRRIQSQETTLSSSPEIKLPTSNMLPCMPPLSQQQMPQMPQIPHQFAMQGQYIHIVSKDVFLPGLQASQDHLYTAFTYLMPNKPIYSQYYGPKQVQNLVRDPNIANICTTQVLNNFYKQQNTQHAQINTQTLQNTSDMQKENNEPNIQVKEEENVSNEQKFIQNPEMLRKPADQGKQQMNSISEKSSTFSQSSIDDDLPNESAEQNTELSKNFNINKENYQQNCSNPQKQFSNLMGLYQQPAPLLFQQSQFQSLQGPQQFGQNNIQANINPMINGNVAMTSRQFNQQEIEEFEQFFNPKAGNSYYMNCQKLSSVENPEEGGGSMTGKKKCKFDTKNLVKNFLNSFLSFIQSEEEERVINKIMEFDSPDQIAGIRKQLKNFFKGKKFNRVLLKEFMFEDNFRPLFQFYLEQRAPIWIESGRMKDKASHQRALKNFTFVCQNYDSIKSWRFRYNFV